VFEIILTHTSGTTTLDREPQDFDKTEFFIRRDMFFHGLFFDFTRKIRFTCNGGGREFVQNIIDTLGIDEIIDITVNFKCSVGDSFALLYDGVLNLESWTIIEPVLEVNIEQTGITQLVKNRGDIEIDLFKLTSLDGVALSAFTFGPYDFTYASKVLFAESELDGGAFLNHHDVNGLTVSVTYIFFFQNPYSLILNDLKETVPNPDTTNFATAASLPTPATFGLPWFHDSSVQDQFILPGTYDVDFDFRGDYIDSNTGASWISGDIELFLLYGQDLATSQFETLGTIPGYASALASVTTAFSFTGSVSIDLAQGDKLWLIWRVASYVISAGSTPDDVDIDFDYTDSEINISISSFIDETSSKAFAIHEAFARICQSITGELDPFRSTYLGRTNSQPFAYGSNGCASFTTLTIGKQIRGFLSNPITVSLNQLFEAYNVIYNLGLGIEDDKVTVEQKEFFYDSSTILLTVENVDVLEISNAPEFYYNEVEIGYNNWEVEGLNALDEYNTKHQYQGPIKVVQNKLTLTTDIITGGYAVEFTRRNTPEITQDWRYDDNKFLIATGRGLNAGDPDELDLTELDENFTTVSNLIDAPRAYNLRFSPKICLLRWANVIGASFLLKPATDILFQSGEANTALETAAVDEDCPGDFSGALIAQDDDLQWDDPNLEDGTPIWVPEIYSFTTSLTFEEFVTIRDDPKGIIRVSTSDTDFISGYILDLRFRIGTNKADFKLLRANL